MAFGPGSVGAIAAGNVVGTAVIRILPDPAEFANVGNLLKSSFNGVDVQIAKYGSLLAGAGAAAGPLLGLVGGLAGAFGAAGAGVAAFGVLAKQQLTPVITATQQVQKEQQAYNQAVASGNTKAATKALQQYQGTLLALPPAQRQATVGILSMKKELKDLSTSVQPQTFGILNNGLSLINGLLPKIAPLAQAAGGALVGVTGQLKNAFAGPGFSQGLKDLTQETGPAIRNLSQAVGNVGVTLGKTFQAAIPILNTAENVLVHITGSLRAGASGGGLQKFFTQLQPAIAQLLPALQSIGRAVGSLLQGAIPLAQPLLKTIGALGNALSNLFKGANFGGFVNNLGKILTSLQPVFNVLGKNIGMILNQLSGQLVAVLPTLIPTIENLANAFGHIIAGLTPALPAILGVVNALSQFIPIVYPLITAFRQALVPILNAVSKALILMQPAIKQIIAALILMLPPISKVLAAIVPIIPAVVQALVPGFQLLAKVLNILAPILTPIINLIAKLAPILTPLVLILIEFTNPWLEIIQIFVLVGEAVTHLGGLWKWLYNDVIKPVVDFIKKVITDAWHVIDTIWHAVWDGIKEYFRIWWLVVSTVVKTEIAIIKDVIFAVWHAIDTTWRAVWGAIKTFFTDLWNGLVWIVKTEIQILHDAIFGTLHAIETVWNSIWGGIKSATQTVWNGIKGIFDTVFGAIKTAFNGVKQGISDIWGGIVAVFKVPINLVIGAVNGFDGVVDNILGVIGVHNLLPRNIPKLAAGGPAWVRGPGGGRDDKAGIFALSNGEHVTNAASAGVNRWVLDWMDRNPGKIFGRMAGGGPVPGSHDFGGSNYGPGNVVIAEGTVPKGKGLLGQVWDDTGGKLVHYAYQGFREAALLGLEAAEAPFRAIVNGISAAGLPGQMVKTGVNHTFDQINDWVRGSAKKADNADAAASAQQFSGSQTVGRWSSYVLSALALEGLPQSLVSRVLNQINLESGGNPAAINLWDSNAAKGQPSKGLLQAIDSTFNAYHWPGTSWSIYDPFANIAAAINYGYHRYGLPTLGMGLGHGYQDGTMFVPNTGPAILHQGEIVIPRGPSDAIRRMATGGPVSSGFASAANSSTILNYNAADIPAVTGINTNSVRAGFLATYNKDIQQAFVDLVKNNQVIAQERATYTNLVAAMKSGNIAQAKADEAHLLALEAQGKQYLANAASLQVAAKAQQALAGSTAATANVLKNQVAGAITSAYAPAVASINSSLQTNAQSGSSITDLFSYQAGYGATSAGAAISLLKDKIARTKTFILNLTKLAKAGMDPTLIAQLAAAGEQTAGSITQQLLADPASIAQLNALENQLNTLGSGGAAVIGNAAVAAKTGGAVNGAGGTAIDPTNLLGLGPTAGGATLNIYGGVTVQSGTDIAKIGQMLYTVANQTARASGSTVTTG